MPNYVTDQIVTAFEEFVVFPAAQRTWTVALQVDPDNPLTLNRWIAGVQRIREVCLNLGLSMRPKSYARILNDPTPSPLQSAMVALMQLEVPDWASPLERSWEGPWKFVVSESPHSTYPSYELAGPSYVFSYDHGAVRAMPFGEVRISPGSAPFTCSLCGRLSPQLHTDMENTMCGSCGDRCRTCNAVILQGLGYCDTHAPSERTFCAGCGNAGLAQNFTYTDYYDGMTCDDCIGGTCQGCGDRVSRDTDLCSYCRDEVVDEDEDEVAGPVSHGETFEEEEKEEAELIIPTIPGRENIRLCGLEIEGSGRGRMLAASLYSAGLSQYDHQLSYHTQTQLTERDVTSGSRSWTVENDSSVDWEMVSPPLNIADRDDIRQLRSALSIVRGQIKEGNIGFDLRCGLHIHVGAEKVGIQHAWHLGQVWGYLEDVIFRLGAAKWPYHRAIERGLHYCNPTPKGAKTKLEFGVQLDNGGSDRYNALSFSNYIRAFTNNCRCGAVRYDSWDECTCSLGKCTFEFRVFNTSANMHKIHAYMALCQALVAWSTSQDTLDVSAFPPLTYNNALLTDMVDPVRTKLVDAWKERLDFIFNQLPLTEGEKRDLLYCVNSSELGPNLDAEFIDALPLSTYEEAVA